MPKARTTSPRSPGAVTWKSRVRLVTVRQRTTFPAKTNTARQPAYRGTSHNDGELESMKSPRAPTRHGAEVLRLDDQHTGRARFPVVRLYVAGTTQGSIQGGREEEDGRGVLTSGRWCSRGRLGVDVPGGGVTSASVPWPSTMLTPTARRLPSS
jgi:hypothetical protein